MRQTTGSIVCPSCGKLIDVDEMRCPFCNRWRPGMFGYAATLQRFVSAVDINAGIMGYSVLLYLIALVLDPSAAFAPQGGILSLLSPGGRSLILLGMTYGDSLYDGRWYTMIASVFLHGSLLHIFFNLLWIRSLGPTVEDGFGTARYFIIFMAAGIGGFLVSNVFSGAPSVGASGGVFGLLAATVAYGRRYGGSFGSHISQRALMWAGMLLLLGFMLPRTNNLAHLGGFAFGYLASLVFLPQAEKREGPMLQLGALVLALGSILAVIASLVSATPYFLK